MKIYDISQELFSCVVFPGDRPPRRMEDLRMSQGAVCNLTSLELCAHNGTHLDAPFHFIPDGETVERIPLEKVVGMCYVACQEADIGAAAARQILETAARAGDDCARRILIRGRGVVTLEAARVLARAGTWLIGVESQTVGPEDGPMAVHQVLLGAKTVLLEGLRLGQVGEGAYFLSAAPLCLAGSDGAPCRAILLR